MSISQERPLTIIQSPHRLDSYANEEYAKDCVYDSLMRGEAPISLDLLYLETLDMRSQFDRDLGRVACAEIMKRADLMAVYIDRGISLPMRNNMHIATIYDIEVVERTLHDAPITRPNKYR